MTSNQNTTSRAAVSTRTRTAATHATAGEVMVLTMMSAVALTSMAIGAWSVLAFAGALAGQGPMGLIGGFFQAVTGL